MGGWKGDQALGPSQLSLLRREQAAVSQVEELPRAGPWGSGLPQTPLTIVRFQGQQKAKAADWEGQKTLGQKGSLERSGACSSLVLPSPRRSPSQLERGMQFSTVHLNCLLDSNHLPAHVCFTVLRLTCICVRIHMLLFLKKG